MNQEETNSNIEYSVGQTPHRKKTLSEGDRFFKLRNILNIIFMVGAIIGVIFYLTGGDNTTGIIIILTAMVFKIAECCFRFIR